MFELIKGDNMVINLPIVNGRSAIAGEAITDGDTLYGSAEGYLSIRFCNIDTPEKGLSADNDAFKKRYYRTDEFTEYLENPFDKKYENSDEFYKALGKDLVENHIQKKLGSDTAINHKKYADTAREILRELVEEEIGLRIRNGENFRFEAFFSLEILDRYGRFLAWVKTHNPKFTSKSFKSYNEIILEKGMAIPYLIWPNISIHKRDYTLRQMVPSPDDFEEWIINDPNIKTVRRLTAEARKKQIGIFSNKDPLILNPFELRYLIERNYGQTDDTPLVNLTTEGIDDRSYKKPVFRYVINLSKPNAPKLIPPDRYFEIEKEEDRLFIPPEYVPLFREKGYLMD